MNPSSFIVMNVGIVRLHVAGGQGLLRPISIGIGTATGNLCALL